MQSEGNPTQFKGFLPYVFVNNANHKTVPNRCYTANTDMPVACVGLSSPKPTPVLSSSFHFGRFNSPRILLAALHLFKDLLFLRKRV